MLTSAMDFEVFAGFEFDTNAMSRAQPKAAQANEREPAQAPPPHPPEPR